MGIQPNTTTSAQRLLVILAMTGSLSLIMMDITIVAIALPEIGRDLALSSETLHWVINAYIVVMASMVALGGRVGDLIGKRTAFIAGITGFALSSLVCGLAESGAVLIGARIVQGISAVLMQPASSAIVLSIAPPESRGKVMAVYVGIPLLFLTMGPVLGGIITEYAGWRWNFFLNLPVAILAIVLTVFSRVQSPRATGESIDPLATLLLLVSFPMLVIGLQQSAVWGYDDQRTLSLVLGGLGGLVLFMWRQKRAKNPTLHLELFKDRVFLCSCILLFLSQFALTGSLVQLAMYAQIVLGYDSVRAGLSILPLMLPILFMVHYAGRTYDRKGVKIPVVIGSIGSGAGLVTMGIGALQQSYPIMAGGMVVLGLSSAFVTMPANTEGMARVGQERRAQASGLLQTFRQSGAAFGVAIFTAIGVWARTSNLNLEGQECESHTELVDMAMQGDVDSYSALVGTVSQACLELVYAALSMGTGIPLCIAGIAVGLGVLPALKWCPTIPFSRASSSVAKD